MQLQNLASLSDKKGKIEGRFLSFFLQRRRTVIAVILGTIFSLGIYVGGLPSVTATLDAGITQLTEIQGQGIGVWWQKYAKGYMAEPKHLTIDIKHKHWQRLAFKRQQAIERGIIVTEGDSYVPAKIAADGNVYNVKLRLKGDYPDHLEGDKWSLRVKVKNADTIWGMKNFSIQDPRRSGWTKEWLMHQWLAYEGLIGLRYDFVDVVINGESFGVYALEESFGKELLEHNQRREGPILKFDESQLIRDSVTMEDEEIIRLQPEIFNTAGILRFNTSKVFESDALKKQFFTARSLLSDLRAGKKELSEVVDVERAARLFAMMNIIGSGHALRWKNIRFYYSPVSSRIELIAYNAYTHTSSLGKIGGAYYQYWALKDLGLVVFDWFNLFFSDQGFVERYFSELERLSTKGYLEGFFSHIQADYEEKKNIIYQDAPMVLPTEAEYLENRDKIASLIKPERALRAYIGDVNLQSGQVGLTVANISVLPIRLMGIECSSSQKNYSDISHQQLSGKVKRGPLEYEEIRVGGISVDDASCFSDTERVNDDLAVKGLRLQYQVIGSKEVRTVQVDANPIGLMEDIMFFEGRVWPSLQQLSQKGFLTVSRKSREIQIKPGKWTLDFDLVFPRDYKVVISKGTEIQLNNHASIVSRSPVFFRGTQNMPVRIFSGDGTGQGLAVINAHAPSELEHVIISGMNAVNRAAWELTGAVTFYESDVDIRHCSFEKAKAEDMLNIVRSGFTIEDSSFEESASDALDVDFGNGNISRTNFSKCGNDCIDISGTKASIDEVSIHGAGDKGISIGEQSNAQLQDISIMHAKMAVASKDASQANIERLSVSDTGVGLAVYQKKSEYAGGSISGAGISMERVTLPYLRESGSDISIAGQEIPSSDTATVQSWLQ